MEKNAFVYIYSFHISKGFFQNAGTFTRDIGDNIFLKGIKNLK